MPADGDGGRQRGARHRPGRPTPRWIKGLIPQRTTLDTLLRGHGVADDAAVGVVHAAARVFDPRRLRSLQPFSLERTLEGALRLFEYEVDANDRSCG